MATMADPLSGDENNPIDLTAPAPAATIATPTRKNRDTNNNPLVNNDTVRSGRVSKSKATPRKKKAADPNAANTPTKGKASGPACLNCRKGKARCDRVLACERCLKAGVDCPGSGSAAGGGADGDKVAGGTTGGSVLARSSKACDRCRRLKSACVRKDNCVRCERRGLECVVG